MIHREIGNSGLSTTAMGLGLAALGRPGYINIGHAQDLNRSYAVKIMEENAHLVLDAAWAAGIRYFDAARSYGRAEHFLSSWLNNRGIEPNDVVIGSKWGYTYTAAWQIEAEHHEIKEHSSQVLSRQWQESNQLLSPYLDLYQIHSATLESGVLQNNEVLEGLAQIKSGGTRIGLSLSGPQQAKTLYQAMEIRVDGQALFDTVQATWNLLAQEAGEALNKARQIGMGVIVKEALANGRLTDRNTEPLFMRKKGRLESIAARYRTTIDALALAVVLHQPWSDIVLSGAATVDHLQANVAAIDLELGDEIEELQDELREIPDQYWSTRSQLAWN
ncbi:MAG: aldo/keto reductase [Candidatus Promineifilaceae bacterium]|nr:aldo/keto reductase [Candidatus Promineifilaceae bacterium]